jgi:hypothetical protein
MDELFARGSERARTLTQNFKLAKSLLLRFAQNIIFVK